MTQKNEIKVFLADDHEYVIMGLKSYLESNFSDIKIISTASTISEVQNKLSDTSMNIDIVVLDYSFGDGYGEEILTFVKSKKIKTKIIFLSAHDELALVHKVLKQGALGFVLKTDPIAEISEAIYSVYHGEIFLNHKLSKRLYNFSHSLSENEISLVSKREKEILKLFLEGLSTNEISEKLFISVSTVETHKKNLYKKFKVVNSTALMQAVMKYKHLL